MEDEDREVFDNLSFVQVVSFLESGLTVETKVKPDSRKDTIFDRLHLVIA
jgi:hypothetical protein